VEWKALKPFLDTLPRMAAATSPSRSGRLASAADPRVVGQASRLPKERLAEKAGNAGETPVKAGGTPAPLPLARSRERLVASFRKSTLTRMRDAKIQLARVSKQPRYPKAVNIDYSILIGSTNSYTFKSDETAYITGGFSPATALFEGGTVLKFAPTNGASIYNSVMTFAGTIIRVSQDLTFGPIVITPRADIYWYDCHDLNTDFGNA